MRTFLFIFISTFCTFLFSQNKNHQLLWKISGNGLKQPSYIYGTMHLQDNRLFNFSDSVFLKIDECKHFALEVDPDSLVSGFYSKPFTDAVENKLYEEIYDEEKVKEENPNELEGLIEEFKSKNIDLSKFNFKSKEGMKYFVDHFFSPSKDKNTFVDAHLYHIARVRNKNIIGLENLEMQNLAMKHYKNVNDIDSVYQKKYGLQSEREMQKHMISIYSEGRIYDIYNEFGFIFDSTMSIRNHGMVQSALPFLSDGGIFMAVGAAHLAGDNGLIELFRKQGYQVDPVTALFTGLNASLKWADKEFPWITIRDTINGVSFQLPSKAQYYVPKATNGINQMHYYPDIGLGIFYMVYIIPKIENQPTFEFYLDEFKNSHQVAKIIKVKNKGIEGRSIIATSKNKEYIKSDIYFHDGYYFLFSAAAQKQEFLSDAIYNRFVKSIQFTNRKKYTHELNKYEDRAFACDFLNNSIDIKYKDGAYGPITYNYNTFDFEKLVNYNLTILESDNSSKAYRDLFFKNIESNLEDTLSELKIIYRDSSVTPFFKDYFVHSKLNWQYFRILLRGDKIYQIFCTMPDSNMVDDVRMRLSSFKFLPYKHSMLKPYVTPYLDTLNVAYEPKIDTTYYGDYYVSWYFDEAQINHKDSTSSMKYAYRRYIINPYDMRLTHRDSLIKFIKMIEYDSLKQTSYYSSPIDTWTFETKDTNELNHKFYKVILCDSVVHLLKVTVDSSEYDANLMRNYFSSFKLKNPCKPFAQCDSNQIRKKLVSDILHLTDKSDKKRHIMINQLSDKFLPEEKQMFYDDISKRPYSLDDHKYFSSVVSLLAKDTTNISNRNNYLIQIYDKAPDTVIILADVLEVLASDRNIASATIFKSLFKSKSPKFSNEYAYNGIFNQIIDSPIWIKKFLPEIIKIAFESKETFRLYEILKQGLDQKTFTVSEVISLEPLISSILEKEVTKAIREKDSYYSQFYLADMAMILAHFGNNKTGVIDAFYVLTSDSTVYNIANAVRIAYRSKLTIDYEKLFKFLNKDDILNYEVYRLQKEYPDKKIISPKFKNYDEMIKSFIIDKLESYEEIYTENPLEFMSKIKLQNGYTIRYFKGDEDLVVASYIKENSKFKIPEESEIQYIYKYKTKIEEEDSTVTERLGKRIEESLAKNRK